MLSFVRSCGWSRLVACVAVAGATGTASAGPDWVEKGDAGPDGRTAQVPIRGDGVLRLESIAGIIGGRADDFEDMYVIRILEPTTFSIAPVEANFNPVLYLFHMTVNVEALGLLANDDATEQNPLPRLVAMATDGTNAMVTAPGDYLLAIAGLGRVPISATGAIFDIESPTEISGADGPGGFNVLTGWTGVGETGSYNIGMVDVDFPLFPTPGAAGALLLGIGLFSRRRR